MFWVTLLLIASDDPRIPPGWLFNGPWFKFVNMALYALTHGYCTTCAMIMGPASAPPPRRDKAGSIMVTGLITGIFCGQVASFGFRNVGHMGS